MSQYFSEETDKYIAEYLDTEDIKRRHSIFHDHIRPAFEKLIENQIYVYGFFHLDDVDSLKNDCLANLFEQLPKYKVAKVQESSRRTGSSGFAYFNVIAKNWFFQKARELAKRNKIEGEFQRDIDQESTTNENVFAVDSYEDQVAGLEFWTKFYESMDEWRGKLAKKAEKKVLEAVIFLMKNPELVPIYNKKAVYMYLREMTGLTGKQVVMNLKKIRSMYQEWRGQYYAEEREDLQ
jgi:hypothetical protein